jgi:hypothetical protein
VDCLDFDDNLDFCKSIQHSFSRAENGLASSGFEEKFCKRQDQRRRLLRKKENYRIAEKYFLDDYFLSQAANFIF